MASTHQGDAELSDPSVKKFGSVDGAKKNTVNVEDVSGGTMYGPGPLSSQKGKLSNRPRDSRP